MPTIEVKAIIVRCRIENCKHNVKGYCAKEDGEILIDTEEVSCESMEWEK